jgi:hypothetical protein
MKDEFSFIEGLTDFGFLKKKFIQKQSLGEKPLLNLKQQSEIK